MGFALTGDYRCYTYPFPLLHTAGLLVQSSSQAVYSHPAAWCYLVLACLAVFTHQESHVALPNSEYDVIVIST